MVAVYRESNSVDEALVQEMLLLQKVLQDQEIFAFMNLSRPAKMDALQDFGFFDSNNCVLAYSKYLDLKMGDPTDEAFVAFRRAYESLHNLLVLGVGWLPNDNVHIKARAKAAVDRYRQRCSGGVNTTIVPTHHPGLSLPPWHEYFANESLMLISGLGAMAFVITGVVRILLVSNKITHEKWFYLIVVFLVIAAFFRYCYNAKCYRQGIPSNASLGPQGAVGLVATITSAAATGEINA